MQKKYELSQEDIKIAIEYYMYMDVLEQKAPVKEVKINLDPGEKFYNQFDPGKPMSVSATVIVEEQPKYANVAFQFN